MKSSTSVSYRPSREMRVSERLVERVAAFAGEIEESGDQAIPRVAHEGELEIAKCGALPQAGERLVTSR
jgi:hypothetical protein